MGNILCTNSFNNLFRKKTIRILMVGLWSAGRTTILYQLKSGEAVVTSPTTGHNVEAIEHKNLSFEIWDMGGGGKIWPVYRHFFPNEQLSQDLIFVVDSSNREEIDTAKYELTTLWERSEVREDAALLIYANKQDLPDAMNEEEVIERLGLRSFRNKNWYVQTACAVTGDGLYEGLEWLYNRLKDVERKKY